MSDLSQNDAEPFDNSEYEEEGGESESEVADSQQTQPEARTKLKREDRKRSINLSEVSLTEHDVEETLLRNHDIIQEIDDLVKQLEEYREKTENSRVVRFGIYSGC